jgi:GrpB-like predicted nucleotidyltransferase (UPF0157 family)
MTSVSREFRIAPYDPVWPRDYEAEADRIARACRDLPLRIEHVGSTAVPGLSAKPIIDILVGVPPRATREPYIAAIRGLGYDHRGALGIPGRNYFRRGSPRTHHIHLVNWSSALWRDHLLFRDWLRAHESVATEYAVLKRELHAIHADNRERYTESKGPFIKAVLRQASKEMGATVPRQNDDHR